jgi:hypothetical protein
LKNDVEWVSMSFRQGLEERRRKLLARLLVAVFGAGIPSDNLPKKGVHRILVIRPNHRLGNTLLLTPLLADIERAYPGAEVDILGAGTAAAEVFRGYDSVRRLIMLPCKVVRHPLTLLKVLWHLRAQHYDLAIDPCVRSGSGRLFLLLSRARSKLGFVDERSPGAISCGIGMPAQPMHMAQLPVYLLRMARGEAFAADACPGLDIRLTDVELLRGREHCRQLLGNDVSVTPVIALFGAATGAKAFGESWWVSMVEQMSEAWRGTRFIEIVPGNGRSAFSNRFPTYFSTSLRNMAAVMAAVDFVISADCGVMHLAAASRATTAGVFKVTDCVRYAPYGGNNFAILATDQDSRRIGAATIANWSIPEHCAVAD